MNLWFVVKARVVWLFGALVAAAGMLAVLYAAALPFGPALDPRGLLPEIPLPGGGWTLKLVHVSVACALLGMLAGAAGALLAHRQSELLRVARRQAEDRRRRVKQYRSDELADGRREPFLGAHAGSETRQDRRAA